MTIKLELRKEIKVLRAQVARLEEKHEKFEKAVVNLFERIEPFFPDMSEAAKKHVIDALENDL